MIPVMAKVTVKEGKMDEAVAMIKKLVPKVAKEKGTLLYRFCKDPKNPNTIIVMEAYADEGALNAHSTSPYFKEFFATFPTLLDGAPEIVVLEEIASI